MKKKGSGSGLPAVIFICPSHEGIVLGECKARWWPFTAVDRKFSEMRLGRFPAGGLETLEDRCKVLEPMWNNWKETKASIEVLRQALQMKDLQFNHGANPGRAYCVFAHDQENPSIRRAPCPQCFCLYDWNYHDKPDIKTEFFTAGNCAEDDVHLRLWKGSSKSLNKNKDQST
jgi:hypothetical protein